MDFALTGTQTPGAWTDWDRTNAQIVGDAVVVAPDPAVSYVDPTPIAVDPPVGFAAVDIDLDECGNLYVLTPSGEVYRYDPGRERLQRLPCAWNDPAGSPAGLCVTEHTIYTLTDGVVAVSRSLLQPRWSVSAPFRNPLAIAADGETALVLDTGITEENEALDGFLARVGPDGTVARIASVDSPVDLAVDHDRTVHVLARDADGTVVRMFEADGTERGEPLRVPPRIHPVCLEVEDTGGILLGIGPDTPGQPSLFRFDANTTEIERLPAFDRTCSALRVHRRGSTAGRFGVYAVDGVSAQVDWLAGAERRQRNPETGQFDAQVLRRFDSGTPGMHWHRVTLDHDLGAEATQVRVRYCATDNPNVEAPDIRGEALPVRLVRGIGPTFAGRLANAGITDLTALAARSSAVIASIVSTEVIDVSPGRTAGWLERAHAIIDAREDDDPLDVQLVRGIGATYGGRLQDAGITDLRELVEYTPEEVAAIVSKSVHTVSTRRVAGWLEQARTILTERGIGEIVVRELPRPNPRDALLDGAIGRFLWVELTLTGAEYSTPRVRAFRAYYPRQSYLRHLPAIYQEDQASAAFLERFLSVFESVFVDIEEQIEGFTRFLDPHGIPAEYVTWLGRWLALEPGETWPTAAKRELIQRAPELFKMRGTRAGLREVLRIYETHVDVPSAPWHVPEPAPATTVGNTNTPDHGPGSPEGMVDGGEDEALVYVWEYADLDCIDSEHVRDAYEELIPCPQCFLVLARSYLNDEMVRTVEEVVASEQPAHAVGRVVQLRPWIELDGHAYLGINSVLPDREFVVAEASLGRDTVLREREPHGQLGVRSRLGTDTIVS